MMKSIWNVTVKKDTIPDLMECANLAKTTPGDVTHALMVETP